MENSWNLFNNSNGGNTSTGRGQNSNCTNLAWDIWDLGWSSGTTTNNLFNHHSATAGASVTVAPTTTTLQDASDVHALMFPHHSSSSTPLLYTGGGSQYHPDPHLMCLKLGKRHYFGDAIATPLGDRHVAAGFSNSITKRGRPYFAAGDVGGGGFVGTSTTAVASPATVPRCQVEGCHVALVNAKEYHRRHKVCEMHSKAPKVVVLGIEQRFCQQCSRFHAVTEFDETKRSCRRRLAGHNERRRKSSHDSIARNPSQGRALSLLSSKNNPLISSTDLSSRCSAALRELIAENRAAILARQLILDRDWPYWSHHSMEDLNGTQPGSNSNPLAPSQHQMVPEPHGWHRFSEAGSHLTLDLMQGPSSAFGFLSMREKSKDEEDECSDELWSSFGGAHVV